MAFPGLLYALCTALHSPKVPLSCQKCLNERTFFQLEEVREIQNGHVEIVLQDLYEPRSTLFEKFLCIC